MAIKLFEMTIQGIQCYTGFHTYIRLQDGSLTPCIKCGDVPKIDHPEAAPKRGKVIPDRRKGPPLPAGQRRKQLPPKK